MSPLDAEALRDLIDSAVREALRAERAAGASRRRADPVGVPGPGGTAALDRLRDLVRDAAHAVVDELAPPLLATLLPRIVAAVSAETEKQKSDAGPEYVSLKDAGKIICAHPETISRLIDAKRLGRHWLGTKPRVKVSELRAYMDLASGPAPAVDLDDRATAIMARRAARRVHRNPGA